MELFVVEKTSSLIIRGQPTSGDRNLGHHANFLGDSAKSVENANFDDVITTAHIFMEIKSCYERRYYYQVSYSLHYFFIENLAQIT